MNRRRSRRVVSKWAKTQALLRNRSFRRYIPATARMNRATLARMLRQHRTVYIKPDCGSEGRGIMKIDRLEERGDRTRYRLHTGQTERMYSSYPRLYASIRRRTSTERYLVQKGIRLLRYRRRSVDIRVLVQQSPSRRWVTTGCFAKIARPGKIVTNVRQGGSVHTAEQVLPALMSRTRSRRILTRLQRLGLRTAKQLEQVYPGLREVGLDVALTPSFRPWILEVNTTPSISFLKKLNARLYAKVAKYARAYGRRC